MATGRAASIARRASVKASQASSGSSSSKKSNGISSSDAKSIQKQIDEAKKLVDKLYADRGLSSSGMPTSARGDEFAPAYEASGMGHLPDPLEKGGARPGETDEQARQRILNSNFGGGGSSTVLSNANKIERVIPLLESRANSLSSYNLSGGGSSFTNIEDDLNTSGGDEETFDDILGFTDPKKKRKPEEMDPYTQAQMKLLEQMQRSSDQSTRQALSTIESKYNQRREDQTRANESGLASVKQALNLAGSSRYAPISSQGIISSAEQAGIRALSALDAEEQQLVSEVKQAQQNNDFQLLEKKLNMLETVRQEKNATASKLQETIQEQEYQSSRDDSIAGLVAQGITNPVEMLNLLNYDDSGNKVGDFTLSEVTGALSSLQKLTKESGVGFKLDNRALGQLLGSGWTSNDIQAFQADLASGASVTDILEGVDPEARDVVMKALGVDTNGGPVRIGVGAKDELGERAIRAQLEPKLMGILNKGAVSDEDRAYVKGEIAFFRDQGLSSQQILDIFSGWSADVNTPYNNAFRDVILANDTDGQGTSPTLTRVGSLLAKNNYTAAMDAVESLAMTNARKLDPDNYLGQASAQFAIKSARDLKKSVKDAEDIIGPLEGTWESVKGRLAKSKDPRAAKVSADIARLTAPMRNQLSGTAVTESETRFLEPLIPTLSDRMENFVIKVDSLENMALDRYNATRQSVSLPVITPEQVLDRKQRVNAYSGDIYSRNTNALDI